MTKNLLKFGRQLMPYKARALGVFLHDNRVYLFYQSSLSSIGLFQIDKSVNGIDFSLFEDSAKIKLPSGKKENIANTSDFRISNIGEKYYLTYKTTTKKKSYLKGTLSSDPINWKKPGNISTPAEAGMLVPNYKCKGEYVLYFGEKLVATAVSSNLIKWRILARPIKQLVEDSKGVGIKIADVKEVKEGILLIYFLKKRKRKEIFSIKAALFDKEQPDKLLWDKIIWNQKEDFEKKNSIPFGAIVWRNKLITYWQAKDGEIFALIFPYFATILQKTEPAFISPIIKKFNNNPILAPIIHHLWESKAVFNPTAFYEEGKVHLVYRAVGEEDVSTLGYATSSDGVTIDKRHKEPIYVPTQQFEGNQGYSPSAKSPFVSGPGWGGVEDPRITKIDGRLYMVYVAFDGSNPPRLALTSIEVSDFLSHHWNWDRPVLISKPGEINKSGSILPERVNGKYVIFHRVYPNILIDFVDSLEFDGKTFLKGEYKITPRSDSWDSRKVGVGPAPLKTEDGWLVFYSGVDDKDDARYKIGAMLLDLADPTRVLFRSPAAILEPTEHYENGGLKCGVVYPCGAVLIDDKLIVYYGGSDTYVCAATAELPGFLTQLKASGLATLKPAETDTNRQLLH